MNARALMQTIDAMQTSDGAGVKLRRSIGSRPGLRLDPFLMLDEFGTENPDDYIAGFPSHPHRGFTTVTYMLDGHMEHRDHLGNVGRLNPGGVQWMNAGRGVIHSEMPRQDHGAMRGFQLWINLPAAEKMLPAAYRDISADEIPVAELPNGGHVKVIAGTAVVGTSRIEGAINTSAEPQSTDPLYVDVTLPPDAAFTQPLTPGHNALSYVIDGGLEVGGQTLKPHAAGILGKAGDGFAAQAGADGARFILLAGKPLGEPVAQYGPFVMNTREEIEQAIHDYQAGTLTAAA